MISAGRNLLLAETIENGYFWSNVVSLGLLGCLFILVVYQQKHLNRAEWKSAEIVAQYEYALKRANVQVADATKRNSEIIEALSASRNRPRARRRPAQITTRLL